MAIRHRCLVQDFASPLPNREDLDDAGKATYDRATKPGRDHRGPARPGRHPVV